MKLTILIIIGVLGLLVPLFWITGTLTSAIYFCLNSLRTIRSERPIALNSQLGLTMADGGDSIDKKKKG